MKLKGEIVREGEAEGKALVTEKPISFLGGIDPETGKIIEAGHQAEGETVNDKILIFPHGKGSTVGSYVLYQLKANGKAPAAIINRTAEPIVAAGAITADIPMLHKFDEDPIVKIKNGDYVKVNGKFLTRKK